MELKNIKITNFLGIGFAELPFVDRGLTLIEGINKDSCGASSNGAGKSSLYEALHWALWGTTKRGSRGDEIINRHGEECIVEVKFDDYLVCRTRKKKFPGLFLYKRNSNGISGWDEITLGTIKDTQGRLEEIIGMSELTFSKLVHFGQESVKDFASLRDSELKAIFEQAMGLNIITEQADKIKKYKGERDDMKQETQLKITRAENEKILIEEKIKGWQELKKAHEANHKTIMENLEKRKQALLVEQQEAANLEVANAAEYETKLKLFAEISSKLQEFINSEQGLKHSHKVEMAKIAQFKAQLNIERQAIQKHLEDLKQADEQIGGPCTKCGRPYTINEIKALKSGLILKIKQHERAVKELEKEIAAHKSQEASLSSLLEEVEQHKAKLSRSVSEGEVKAMKIAWDSAVDIKQQIVQKIKDLEGEIKDTINNTDHLQKQIKDNHKLVGQIDNKLNKLHTHNKNIDKEFELIAHLIKAFSNQGLKSYVMDSVTTDLNAQTNKFLSALDDIEVVINTITQLKNGEYREKFSIDVNNQNGAQVYAGNSGGEKQKINLAIALGFNAVMRGLAANNVNALFLDEPFESLDEVGAERVADICNMLKLPNVFVITHNDNIKAHIPNRITMIKHNGQAEIR